VAKKDPVKEYLKHFFEQLKKEYHRCYYPGEECTQMPCSSHSIQNRRILETLSQDGHVIMPQVTMDRDGLKIGFIRTGVGKASTFTGLCARHDNELFRLVDDCEIDFRNTEQLFLLSYRSVLKGLHACERAAVDMAASYSKALQLGFIESPTDTIEQLLSAQQFRKFKSTFDELYMSKQWDGVRHKQFALDAQRPTIAASSVFPPDVIIDVTKLPTDVAVNIFPIRDKTHIIFSYLRANESQAQKLFGHLDFADKYLLRYEISKLILSRCENFVLSPQIYNTYSERQRETIKNFIMQCHLNPGIIVDHPDLCLFPD